MAPVTKVIFRMIAGQVIALFPEIPAAFSSVDCLYYFSGQYGTCNFQNTLLRSSPCKADDYVDTYQQLIHLRYNLLVISCTREDENILSKERHQRYESMYNYA